MTSTDNGPSLDPEPPVDKPFFEVSDVTLWNADSRDAWKWLPPSSVDAIVTSPPYFGLRDYDVEGQLGTEDDPAEFIETLADLLTGYGERVMKPGGSLWLNLGDSYSNGGTGKGTVVSVPAKCLLMVPERVSLALVERGWLLRNKVVWVKKNSMPTPVQDRLATRWEFFFHLTRQPDYFYDLDPIREPHAEVSIRRGVGSFNPRTPYVGPDGDPSAPMRDRWLNEKGKNPGDVWEIAASQYDGAHFATYPEELVRRPILATVPEGGLVLDPFFGSGTTAVMARRLGRRTWGVDLNPDYCRLAASRFEQDVLPLGEAG